MSELLHVRYVTERYVHLQGLRLVPLGVVFLLAAAWRLRWFTLPGGDLWAPTWFLAGGAAAVLVSFGIRAYYHRRYGRVRPRPGQTGAVGLLSVFVVFVVLGWLQNRYQWSAPVPILFVAICLAGTGVADGRVRQHYLLVAAAALAFAGLASRAADINMQRMLLDLLIGAGLLVAGIGDDHVLRRLLESRSMETDADTF